MRWYSNDTSQPAYKSPTLHPIISGVYIFHSMIFGCASLHFFWGVDFKQKNCLQNWPFLVTMSVCAILLHSITTSIWNQCPRTSVKFFDNKVAWKHTHVVITPLKTALKDTEVFADVGQRGYGLHVGRGSWISNDSDESFEVLLDVEGVGMFMVLSNWVITHIYIIYKQVVSLLSRFYKPTY